MTAHGTAGHARRADLPPLVAAAVDRAAAASAVFADDDRVRVRCGDWHELRQAGPFDLLVPDGGGQGKGDEQPLEPAGWLRSGGLVVIDDFTPLTGWPPTQLPDQLYRDAKRVAEDHEITLAEVVRRGLEYMVRVYPPREPAATEWRLPQPRRLGAFLAPEDQWRTLANES